MCAGGRIVNYLKALLDDSRHYVLFSGDQAKGALGQIIQQYGPKSGHVDLDCECINIRACIETLGGYSAHSDQHGLHNFVTRIHRPQDIRLVHGEEKAKRELAETLAAISGEGQGAAGEPVGASLLAIHISKAKQALRCPSTPGKALNHRQQESVQWKNPSVEHCTSRTSPADSVCRRKQQRQELCSYLIIYMKCF